MHGILVGLCSFLLIGLFHPIVIKAEYHFSKRIYPLFIVAGIMCLFIALVIENQFFSSLLGVAGFSSFWSVKELFEQERRVQKGWFPKKADRQ